MIAADSLVCCQCRAARRPQRPPSRRPRSSAQRQACGRQSPRRRSIVSILQNLKYLEPSTGFPWRIARIVIMTNNSFFDSDSEFNGHESIVATEWQLWHPAGPQASVRRLRRPRRSCSCFGYAERIATNRNRLSHLLPSGLCIWRRYPRLQGHRRQQFAGPWALHTRD